MARELKSVPSEDLLAIVSSPSDAAVAGDAVAELVVRYQAIVYRAAIRICGGDRGLAEDVFQETFVRMSAWVRDRSSSVPIHDFPVLLAAFTRRTAIDLIRRERRQSPSGAFEEALEIADPNGGAESRRDVLKLIDMLGGRYREVLVLTVLQGLSAVEAADRMGLSPGNVRMLRLRATRALATLLNEERPEQSSERP